MSRHSPVAWTPSSFHRPFFRSPSSHVSVDLRRPVISIGEPSRGVAGRPLFPALSDEPILSIQVLHRLSVSISSVCPLTSHSPAVVSVPAVDETRLPVDPDLLVETFIPHVHVEIRSSLLQINDTLA